MGATNNSGHRGRLRKRFLSSNGRALEDYELLELLLFAARPREDVKWIAKSIFLHFDRDIVKVFNASLDDLMRVYCVTESIASAILCCSVLFERNLFKRLRDDFFAGKVSGEIYLRNLNDLVLYARQRIASDRRENSLLLYLNGFGKVVADEVLSHGTIDSVIIHVREIINKIICKGSKSVVLVHNHPSGLVNPSKSDISLTKDLHSSCESVGVRLIDHIIVARDDYFSFYIHGLLS